MQTKDLKEEIINFIQDQQSHEVDNEVILNKIPNLVEYLFDHAIQSAVEEREKELREEFRGKNLEGKLLSKRKDVDVEIVVRKMNDDEIDNSECQYYVEDESGAIYEENELLILSELSKKNT